MVLLCGVSVVAQVDVPVRVEVRSDGGPVAGAAVTVAGRQAGTDASGTATLAVPAGPAQITVVKDGFLPATVDIAVAGSELQVIVELTAPPEIAEEVVVVATTRTGRRLEDQPTRVEVLGREEIEEKMLMTPGDIVMMLNEMGGLRVQATSPSLGAASVRVQGMRGRYTRFLTDGLPLFGQQVGGLGLLQIPPMDLGQVEVIKGVASALYGAGAMGGVVNLLSRRPGAEPVRDDRSSINRRSARPTASRSSSGPLGAAVERVAARQRPLPDAGRRRRRRLGRCRRLRARRGPAAAVLGRRQRPIGVRDRRRRPTRIATAARCRGAALAATGQPYTEALDTRRYDVGGIGQTLLRNRYVLDRARRGGLAAPRSSVRRHARARPARHGVRRSGDPRRRRAATPGSPARPSSATPTIRSDVPRFALHVRRAGHLRAGRRRPGAVAVAVGERARRLPQTSTARSSARASARWSAAAAGPAASPSGRASSRRRR